MIRKFCLILHLSLILGSLFANDKIDFKKNINESTGYYYCEEQNSIVHLSMSDDDFLVIKNYSFDFNNNTIKSNSTSRTNLFLNDHLYYKNKARFKFEHERVVSFLYMSELYVPIQQTTEDEIFSFMSNKTNDLFEYTVGEYFENETNQTFKISKTFEILNIITTSINGDKTEDSFRIESPKLAIGNIYRISYSDNKFELYYPDGTDYLNCMIIFEIEDKSEIEEVHNIELYSKYYTFGVSNQKLIVDDDKVIVIHTSDNSFNSEYDLYSYNFKVFIDDYGYKHVEIEDDKFIIIDGEKQNITFRYNGDSLRDDNNSVNQVFKSYPETWTNKRYTSGYQNINGGYFTNVEASSTLKDNYYEYIPEGTMRVFNPSENPRFWVKHNIPWVEGKVDDGIGESIEFDIIQIDWRAVVGIDLRILNGYVDPLKPYLFYQNNRLKTALIETDTGYITEINFNDKVEFTSVSLPKETLHVKITIKDVYRGTKFRDTCITAFDMYYDLWDK